MFQPKKRPSQPAEIARLIFLALLVFAFTIIVIVTAITLLTGESLAGSPAAMFAASPRPQPGPTTTIVPLAAVTPGPVELTPFRSVALGFTADYPSSWRKKESSLQIIFAPSVAGLEPEPLLEPAIRIGIPTDSSFEPPQVLTNILADFPSNTKPTSQGVVSIAGVRWTLTDLTFENEPQGQRGLARVAIASHNEVGYFVIAMAPAAQWPLAEAAFQSLLDSFRFTQEAVIRPTDASPPPTPTPSPTPRVYIVQSGDTLGGIALQFGVTIEALVTRNGLEDARYIRSGQKLIIPNKKR